jgi:ABC-2 type transport system permease protein
MWQTAKATFLRNQMSNLRAYPWSFAFGHIVDGIYIVLISWFSYHYLIEGQLDGRFRQYAGSSDYLTFAVIGGILANVSVAMMMNVSRALITEYREGTLEALLLAPSSRLGYLMGVTLQQFFRIVVEMIPVLLIGLWIGLHVPHADFLSALLLALLYFGACFSMGLVLGSVMLATRDTYLVQNTLFSVTTLLCGFQFPRDYLPEALQWAGEVFPLTGSLHMLRNALLNGTPIGADPAKLCATVLLIIVYGIIGFKLISRTERTILIKTK